MKDTDKLISKLMTELGNIPKGDVIDNMMNKNCNKLGIIAAPHWIYLLLHQPDLDPDKLDIITNFINETKTHLYEYSRPDKNHINIIINDNATARFIEFVLTGLADPYTGETTLHMTHPPKTNDFSLIDDKFISKFILNINPHHIGTDVVIDAFLKNMEYSVENSCYIMKLFVNADDVNMCISYIPPINEISKPK